MKQRNVGLAYVSSPCHVHVVLGHHGTSPFAHQAWTYYRFDSHHQGVQTINVFFLNCKGLEQKLKGHVSQ